MGVLGNNILIKNYYSITTLSDKLLVLVITQMSEFDKIVMMLD